MNPHDFPWAPMAPPRRLVILVIERDEACRAFFAATLEQAGYQVACEPTIAAAVGAAARHGGAALLLVAVPLVAGPMFETLLRFRADPPTSHIPVIVLTPVEDAYAREQIVRSGATGILVEPVKRSLLLRQVRRSFLRTQMMHPRHAPGRRRDGEQRVAPLTGAQPHSR